MSTVTWVAGTTRSGTSWVFDLVASHPDISMGFESKIPLEGIVVYQRWKNRLGDPLGMAGLLEDLRTSIDDPTNSGNNEMAFLQPDLPLRIFEAHEADPSWATVCEHLFRAVEGTSHWGNKILRIETTPTLRRHWPDSRFLVLTRDPRAVMTSQSRSFGHSLDYSASYWLKHADWVIQHCQDDPECHVVDIVEMAKDPRPHLEWLFTQAGLSTDPIEDLVRRFPGDPEKLEEWRNRVDPAAQKRMAEYCFSQMLALGYEPELATHQRELGVLRRLVAEARTWGPKVVSAPRQIRQKQVIQRLKEVVIGS